MFILGVNVYVSLGHSFTSVQEDFGEKSSSRVNVDWRVRIFYVFYASVVLY